MPSFLSFLFAFLRVPAESPRFSNSRYDFLEMGSDTDRYNQDTKSEDEDGCTFYFLFFIYLFLFIILFPSTSQRHRIRVPDCPPPRLGLVIGQRHIANQVREVHVILRAVVGDKSACILSRHSCTE